MVYFRHALVTKKIADRNIKGQWRVRIQYCRVREYLGSQQPHYCDSRIHVVALRLEIVYERVHDAGQSAGRPHRKLLRLLS